MPKLDRKIATRVAFVKSLLKSRLIPQMTSNSPATTIESSLVRAGGFHATYATAQRFRTGPGKRELPGPPRPALQFTLGKLTENNYAQQVTGELTFQSGQFGGFAKSKPAVSNSLFILVSNAIPP